MNIHKIYILFIFFFMLNCAGYESNKRTKLDNKIYYSSTGFALIYDESLYKRKVINKKINNDEMLLLHRTLKKNTRIQLTNLDNLKSIELKVYKKANYPKIFNAVISKKIATTLNIDLENPFIEIIELKKNKKFIAKEGSIFEEEKKVADKAPVDEIEMKTIEGSKNTKIKESNIKDKFIIVISDFYYENSAINLRNNLLKKISSDNISIK